MFKFKVITCDMGCVDHPTKIAFKVMFKKPLLGEWKHSFTCLHGNNHTVTYLLVKPKYLPIKKKKRGPISPLLTNKCKVGKFFKHKSVGVGKFYGKEVMSDGVRRESKTD